MNKQFHIEQSGGYFVLIILFVLLMISLLFIVKLYAKPPLEAARVIVYEGPAGISEATDRIVKVEGVSLFVYDTAVNHNRSWERNPPLSKTPMAYFDFSGKVEITIEVPEEVIESVIIRPLSLGIKPKIKGQTITFTLDKPSQLTIEINNSIERALHLFANPIEINPPKEGDQNVIYLGPGVHRADRIPVKSNSTIYIAGGAVVYGVIQGTGVENVTVTGRGIICGSIYDRWSETMIPIDFRHSKNITIEGVIFLDPAGWTVNTYFCEGVSIDNIKIITARSNGDGITTQSSKNVNASNSFVRTWDDSLVVKNYDKGSTSGITFNNIIIWTDLAQSCEIGYETAGSLIEWVTFQNITVLHNFHKPVLSIHNSDNAMVNNIYYKNIVVENAQMGEGDGFGNHQLIELTIRPSQWSTANERGHIENVFFEDITVLNGKRPPSRFLGFNEQHQINNVQIKNLKILGEQIGTLEQGDFEINAFAQNISIE